MDLREFLLRSGESDQSTQEEIYAQMEEIKRNPEFLQPLFEIILSGDENLGIKAVSIWSKIFTRFYPKFVETSQIAEIKEQILALLRNETISFKLKEIIIEDVIRVMDEGVKEWPELFEFVAQCHSESVEMLHLAMKILIEASDCLLKEELLQFTPVYFQVLEMSNGIDGNEEITALEAKLLSKAFRVDDENDFSPFFDKVFSSFQQIFVANPNSQKCLNMSDSISKIILNKSNTCFDPEQFYTQICGIIQPDHCPWIPISLLSRFVKVFGENIKESFAELIGMALTCAMYCVENQEELSINNEELEATISIMINLPMKCMKHMRTQEFLSTFLGEFPTDSNEGLYVTLQLIREIINNSSDALPYFIKPIKDLVESSFQSDNFNVIKAGCQCAGDIAIYTYSFFDLGPTFTAMVELLSNIVSQNEEFDEDMYLVAEALVEYITPFLAYAHNLNQESVSSLMTVLISLIERELFLVKVLYCMMSCFEALSSKHDFAQQISEIIPHTLEVDELRAPTLELIGSLIANIPDVFPLETYIQPINEAMIGDDISIDLLISAYTALTKILISPYLEGSEVLGQVITQVIVQSVSLLTKNQFISGTNTEIETCRNNIFALLALIIKKGFPIEEEVQNSIYLVAAGYSSSDDDDTYAISLPLVFTLEVKLGIDFDDDLLRAMNQCQGSKTRVIASLKGIKKLIKTADDLFPEQVQQIFALCIACISRDIPCMEKDKADSDVFANFNEIVHYAIKCIVAIVLHYRDHFQAAEYLQFLISHCQNCSDYEKMLLLTPFVAYCQNAVDTELLSSIYHFVLEISQNYDCRTPPHCIRLMRACSLLDPENYSETSLAFAQTIAKGENGINENVYYQQAVVCVSSLILSIIGHFEMPPELIQMAIQGMGYDGLSSDVKICVISLCNLAEQSPAIVSTYQQLILSTLQQMNVGERKYADGSLPPVLREATQQLIAVLSGETPPE